MRFPVRAPSWKVWVSLYAVGILACGGGPTEGENLPGDETDLDPDPGEHTVGALAIQPDEAFVWFVHQGTNPQYGQHREFLTAVPSYGEATYRNVIDLTGTTDRWALFPDEDRLLLLSQAGITERLSVFDAHTLEPIASNEVAAEWQSPRSSPSGNWVTAVNDAGNEPAIDLIDTGSLQATRLFTSEHAASGIHATWAKGREWLLALNGGFTQAGWAASRVLRYDFEAGVPSSPDIDITLPDLCLGYGSSMIAVSPDDRWAVFTLIDCPTGVDPLVVLDLSDGSHRISSLTGPVTFTPDSSTIVGYGTNDSGESVLKLIDAVTLDVEVVPVPVSGTFVYFVTPEGNWIVCTPVFDDGKGSLVLYDASTGTSSSLAGPAVSFGEFVYRASAQQMWIADDAWLYRLDLPTSTLSQVPIGVPVRRINILPSVDRLVVSEPEGGRIHFISPATGTIVRTVEVPSPLDGVLPTSGPAL